MRIAFTTFGCKINQYETDLMRQTLADGGNTIVPHDCDADVHVINTCSVTARSDYQCRQAIRAAVRRGAKVVVTGCYAETRPEEIKRISGVDLVLGNREKTTLVEHLTVADEVRRDESSGDGARRQGKNAQIRTREFLKIQDGCDNRCSYCIVPIARGASRSVPPDQVIRDFDQRVASGCPEVVLSGIHIGKYGQDLSSRETLTGLLKSLIARQGLTRIRLSSIEPGEITEEMIDMLGQGLCRHLHVPLQSGDDGVLSRMNRNYSSRFYCGLLEKTAKKVPGIALGADVMVGFPGEGDREFENTFDLVKDSPLTHLHVFSYSPRPGTAAAAMKGQVPERTKRERSEALRKLGLRKNYEFRKSFLGAKLNTVVEDKKDALTGYCSGTTDNYIRVAVNGLSDKAVGKEIPVIITDVKENDTIAYFLHN